MCPSQTPCKYMQLPRRHDGFNVPGQQWAEEPQKALAGLPKYPAPVEPQYGSPPFETGQLLNVSS